MSEMTIIPDLYLEGDSKRWKKRQAMYLDIKTCQDCREKHGKIYGFSEKHDQPEHEHCRCSVMPMRTKAVGTATDRGFDGADAWLMYRNRLPDYYVAKDIAKAYGYRRKKNNLADVLSGYMIGGDEFLNDKGKLPCAPARTSHEADVDYTHGKRNLKRVLYSNNGLVFVSEDHYQTFYEITKWVTYTVDFSKVKHYIEIHEVLKNDLDFPDYYGGNTDALWDCLTDMLGDPSYIEFFGFEEIQKKYKSEWDGIVRIFKKAKHAYNDKYSNSFIVILVHNNGTREEIE